MGLRGVQIGVFGLEGCVTLEALEAMNEAERLQALQPVDILLTGHAPVMLAADDAARFLTGLRRRGTWPDADHLAVYGPPPAPGVAVERVLLGTAHAHAGQLIPTRLLSPLEITQALAQHPPDLPA